MADRRFLTDRRRDVHLEERWSQFGYASRRLRETVAALVSASELRPGDRALDFGCGTRPYMGLFPADTTYIGADLPGNDDADLCIDEAGRIPLEDGAVALVLSSQVLEHVEDPEAYLAECHRLLRPGGSLVVSTHGLMYYHRDPEDYWRWTHAGLRKIVVDAGFEVRETRGVLGLAAAGLQVFQDGTVWKVPRVLRRLYIAVLQIAIALSDRAYSAELRAENSLTIAIRAVRVDGLPSAPDA